MTNVDLNEFLSQSTPSRWQRWRRRTLVGIPLLLGALLLVRCFRPPPAVQYVTTPVIRHNLDVVITATGNLAPTVQVNVGSEESGLVDHVYVQNNDRVVKGQPLAQLDLSRLRDALLQSRASLQAALASVASARATVAQTSATLARQRTVYQLSGGKVPSRTEIDIASADAARAAANLNQAQAQVSLARANMSTSQTNLAKGTIYAPVTGVVLSRQVELGQTVAASFNVATLFTIAQDLSSMKLQVKVDEADVAELHPGARAAFTVDAYPGRSFPAIVTRVDVGANATPIATSAGTTPTTTSNVVSYTAELAVNNAGGLLRPGMTATASIVTETAPNQLLVASAALRFKPSDDSQKGGMFGQPPEESGTATASRGARQQLWLVGDNGKLKSLSVIVGHSSGNVTEVSGPGLRAGMRVVTGVSVSPN